MADITKHTKDMLRKGHAFAKLLPNYRLLGVDPGFLFVSDARDHRQPLDLPEDVIDSILSKVSTREQ